MARFEMVVTAAFGIGSGLEVNLDEADAGQDRDSMCSMPLPRVKKRSKRPVMSVSICSGGMPLKKVATTTTGILISGKEIDRHAHQRALMPTTIVMRQRTTMK
jgi:hypothetical protein